LLDDDGGSATVTTNLTIRSGPLRPTLTSFQSNGSPRLRLQGTPRANYQLQASQDLQNWATIAICAPNTNNLVEFAYPDRARYRIRFYRAMWNSQSLRPEIISSARTSDSHFHLKILGQPGNSCRIQTSTNLLNWIDWTSTIADPYGVAEFDDPGPLTARKF